MTIDSASISLKEDGQEIQDKKLEQPDSASVLILIDVSSSMKPYMRVQIAAASALILALRPQDEVAVIACDVQQDVLQPLTSNRVEATNALSKIRYGGGSSLYDSIAASASYLRTYAHHPLQAIVLLSDGADNYSRLTPEDLHRSIFGAQPMLLYGLQIENPRVQDSSAFLSQISAYAGALSTNVLSSDKEASGAAKEVAADLSRRFLIQYSSAHDTHDGKPRKIQVELPGQKVKILAVKEVYAPKR